MNSLERVQAVSSKRQRCRAIYFGVDSYANGIAFGRESFEESADPQRELRLRLPEEQQVARLRHRYILARGSSNDEFERLLMRLSKQGILSNATIVLGTAVDPFLPFENKFEVSSRFLSLFERYQPARLIVQTRSPLIVIALPVLKRLAKRLIVTVPLETGDDEAMQRYVPGLPNATERLKMMRALRKFGISVIAQVMPLLPYGDWRNDARAFATVLENSADFITLAPLCDGTPSLERRVRNSSIGQRLAAERRFHWLRPDACAPLRAQLETLCPNKLIIPAAVPSVAEQLKFFAA